MNAIVCSRCKESYKAIYEGQGDGCCCGLDLSPPIETVETVGDELPPFWISGAVEAHEKVHLAAGYGSAHDLCTFAFVDSRTEEELKREEIVKKYSWARGDVNICDECIDVMLELDELKKVYYFDPCFDEKSLLL